MKEKKERFCTYVQSKELWPRTLFQLCGDQKAVPLGNAENINVMCCIHIQIHISIVVNTI